MFLEPSATCGIFGYGFHPKPGTCPGWPGTNISSYRATALYCSDQGPLHPLSITTDCHWVQVDFDEKRHVNEPSEAQVRLLTWCGLWVRVSHIGGPIELSNPENLRGGAGGRPGSDAGFGPLPASLLVVSKPWCSYLGGSGVDEVMNLG